MADEPQEVPQKKKKGLPKTAIIVAGVALVEAAVFFAVFKFAGSGPEAAHGESNPSIAGPAASQPVMPAEVALVQGLRVPNEKRGQMWIYDVDVTIVVPASEAERIQKIVDERSGEIGDRVGRIVRGATARMLEEDDLRALKNQLTLAVQDVFQDESVVQRILIPRFVPMRSD